MKKISIFITILLVALMGLNINIVLRGSNMHLQDIIIEAFGGGGEGSGTLHCDKYDDCYTGHGCRCYKSNYMRCPECGKSVYMCVVTNKTSDFCGWFELTMQGGSKQHASGCSKEPPVHEY